MNKEVVEGCEKGVSALAVSCKGPPRYVLLIRKASFPEDFTIGRKGKFGV
jgi:hypothetical protein